MTLNLLFYLKNCKLTRHTVTISNNCNCNPQTVALKQNRPNSRINAFFCHISFTVEGVDASIRHNSMRQKTEHNPILAPVYQRSLLWVEGYTHTHKATRQRRMDRQEASSGWVLQDLPGFGPLADCPGKYCAPIPVEADRAAVRTTFSNHISAGKGAGIEPLQWYEIWNAPR